jgi:hypothetical protein
MNMDEKITLTPTELQAPKADIKSRAGDIASAGLEEAKKLTSSTRDRVFREADEKKQLLIEKLETFADDLEKMGGEGEGEEEDVQQRLVGSAAKTLRSLTRTLGDSSTEELVTAAGRKVRERPGVFLAACLAIGFVGGRMLRR